jgi:hypothetical protein
LSGMIDIRPLPFDDRASVIGLELLALSSLFGLKHNGFPATCAGEGPRGASWATGCTGAGERERERAPGEMCLCQREKKIKERERERASDIR